MANVDVIERRWSWGGGALYVVRLGDETVVFHESTASTHLFDEDTHLVVEALRLVGPAASTQDLWRRAFGATPSKSDCEALDASLEALLQAGMVTAFPS